METTTLLFSLTHAFKDAIGAYAQERNISASELIRRAVAAMIDYDLDAEKANKVERRGRPRMYATSAEREAAVRERAEAKRKLTAMLLDHARQQERQQGVDALVASVERNANRVNKNG